MSECESTWLWKQGAWFQPNQDLLNDLVSHKAGEDFSRTPDFQVQSAPQIWEVKLFDSLSRLGNNKAVHVNHRRSELRECNCCLPSSARSVKKKLGFDLLVFIAPVGTLSPRGKNSMFKFSLNISFGFIFVFESVTVISHKYIVEKSFSPGGGVAQNTCRAPSNSTHSKLYRTGKGQREGLAFKAY